MESLSLPFLLRGLTGRVDVTVGANDDPVRNGCHLLDPALPVQAARGYPVCTATIDYPGAGYTAAMGWIQLVRSTDAGEGFEPDPLALHRGVATPFAFFGIAPALFDAPFRATRADLSWRARTFLCAVPDAVMSRAVEPVTAFTWGFDVADGNITQVGPAPLDGTVWDEHLSLLRDAYPAWRFHPPA